MLRGSRGGGSGSRGSQSQEKQKMSLGIDYRSNSLIIAAPEPFLQEVEQLIWQLDQAAVETYQTMRVVTLHQTGPEAVKNALESMLGESVQFGKSQSSSRSSGSSSSAGGSRPPSQSDADRRAAFIDMMRRRAQGGSPPGGGGPPSGGQPRGQGGPPRR